MKKIFLAAIILMASLYNAEAQTQTRVEIRSVGAGDIEYITKELTCAELHEIITSLPVVLKLVDGPEGNIEVSFPMQEHRHINYNIAEGNIFIIGRNGHQKPPKKSILSEETPIYITISASKIGKIHNSSDLVVYVERDSFADELMISNAGYGFFLISDSITAPKQIHVISTGTLTCEVGAWNTEILKISNIGGYLYIKGETPAKSIEHISSGIENTTLAVNCEKLFINTQGDGLITYRGWVDDLVINSNSKTSVRTSELKVRP